MNLHALTAADGHTVWVSAALPGRRTIWSPPASTGLLDVLTTAGILTFARQRLPRGHPPDRAPSSSHDLPDRRTFNRDHARLHPAGEGAFADLKQWKLLHRVVLLSLTGQAAATAVLVLNVYETG